MEAHLAQGSRDSEVQVHKGAKQEAAIQETEKTEVNSSFSTETIPEIKTS